MVGNSNDILQPRTLYERRYVYDDYSCKVLPDIRPAKTNYNNSSKTYTFQKINRNSYLLINKRDSDHDQSEMEISGIKSYKGFNTFSYDIFDNINLLYNKIIVTKYTLINEPKNQYGACVEGLVGESLDKNFSQNKNILFCNYLINTDKVYSGGLQGENPYGTLLPNVLTNPDKTQSGFESNLGFKYEAFRKSDIKRKSLLLPYDVYGKTGICSYTDDASFNKPCIMPITLLKNAGEKENFTTSGYGIKKIEAITRFLAQHLYSYNNKSFITSNYCIFKPSNIIDEKHLNKVLKNFKLIYKIYNITVWNKDSTSVIPMLNDLGISTNNIETTLYTSVDKIQSLGGQIIGITSTQDIQLDLNELKDILTKIIPQDEKDLTPINDFSKVYSDLNEPYKIYDDALNKFIVLNGKEPHNELITNFNTNIFKYNLNTERFELSTNASYSDDQVLKDGRDVLAYILLKDKMCFPAYDFTETSENNIDTVINLFDRMNYN